MDAQKHKIVSSQFIYKYNLFEIILHTCESSIVNKVVFCLTRRNFKSNDEVKSNKSSNEYNFFWAVDVASKLLQEILGAIDFVKTLSKNVLSAGKNLIAFCD